jgi:hypothetical protein
VSEKSSNINSCLHNLEQMLEKNSFFLFSKETKAFGQLLLNEVKNIKEGVDEEYEEEFKKYQGDDPLSQFLKDKKKFDEIIIGNIAIDDIFRQNNLQNFSLSSFINAVEGEIEIISSGHEGEITEAEAENVLGLFIDGFILSELSNQPFTFQQLVNSLKVIEFTPEPAIVKKYILNRLETKAYSMKQAFFDEQMPKVNSTAYQYLLDTMNHEIMGTDTFTPERRLYLVYNLPSITIPDAIEGT